MAPDAPAAPGSPRSVLRGVLLALVLVGGAAALVYSFAKTSTTHTPRFSDVAVESVTPPAGGLELRQSRIGVDLRSPYTAVLVVDGREIPEDQLERVTGLNQVYFTPGPGTETGALRPGRHCAAAILWRGDQSRAQSRRYSWCFELH